MAILPNLKIVGACNRLMRMKNTLRIHRLSSPGSIILNGHDLYHKGRRYARYTGNGINDFSYFMYDESQEERLLAHIRSLVKGRKTEHPDDMGFYDELIPDLLSLMEDQR